MNSPRKDEKRPLLFDARISAKNTQEPVSGATCLIETNPNNNMTGRIKDYSRERYGSKMREKVPKNNAINNLIKAVNKRGIKQIKYATIEQVNS